MKRLGLILLFFVVAACSNDTSRHLGRDADPLGGRLFRAEGRSSDLLVLDGRITKDTLDIFNALTANPTIDVRGLMIAASPGGDRARALQLAQTIKSRQLNTAVLGACFAVCVDVFLSGDTRGMSREAVLGVPIIRGRFASLALSDTPPSAINGTELDDNGTTFLLIGRDEAFRLGLATERFE